MASVRMWIRTFREKCSSDFLLVLSEVLPCIGYEKGALPGLSC